MLLLLWISQDGGSGCPLRHGIHFHGAPDLPGCTGRKHVPTKKASKTDPFRVGVTIYMRAMGKWLFHCSNSATAST